MNAAGERSDRVRQWAMSLYVAGFISVVGIQITVLMVVFDIESAIGNVAAVSTQNSRELERIRDRLQGLENSIQRLQRPNSSNASVTTIERVSVPLPPAPDSGALARHVARGLRISPTSRYYRHDEPIHRIIQGQRRRLLGDTAAALEWSQARLDSAIAAQGQRHLRELSRQRH